MATGLVRPPPLPQLHEAFACRPRHDFDHTHTGKVTKRRAYINIAHWRLNQPSLHLRRCNHHRHTCRAFKETHLKPQSALAEHIAMIRDKQDRRLLSREEGLSAAAHLAHLAHLTDVRKQVPQGAVEATAPCGASLS